MINSYSLLSALQAFVARRNVDVSSLGVRGMVDEMLAWYVALPPGQLAPDALSDDLVYRYGGWSEGCATGFKVSLLRRLRMRGDEADTDWVAGITLMFEPGGRANISRFSTVSADWPSLEAFRNAIESSPAFRSVAEVVPMAAALESGGLR